MAAFSEFGVMPEVCQAIEEMDWLLPTEIQAESIPLILGGGDVLMAAETGSGKTGAFCIPVIQIVSETLKESTSKKGKKQISTKDDKKWKMSIYDRDECMAINSEGLLCQSRDQKSWHGTRSNKGVQSGGKYYFEATVTDEGLCRVGWATLRATLNLGTDKFGFGFGGTGKKSYARQFDDYGESFGLNDTIGCFLDLDTFRMRYSKNGEDLGEAFTIPKNLQQTPFFAAVVLKNAEMSFNFGDTKFKHPPPKGYQGMSQASSDNVVQSEGSGGTQPMATGNSKKNSPKAIIIEPSRELAEQTFEQISKFKKYLKAPPIRELLIVGGQAAKEQISSLENGVEIVVATPGRLDDLISTGKVSLSQVRFFVLDEADGLLKQGYAGFINGMWQQIPKILDGKRLQMIVCSATLHSFEVKKLAEKIMHFPTWVDLKGQDSVPETVHHMVCIVDPEKDTSWDNNTKYMTDGVHYKDNVKLGNRNPETFSEAVKLLKPDYVIKAIQEHKIDQAIIFCRTKLDCDNLERYFISMGGGPDAKKKHQFSCVCLHSDRNPQERKNNLQMFKQANVRFLICTDVAARGIDIRGIPFVINVTLPDEKQNYVHRIGRVGRADRMGLAISLVAKVQEKVWYHTCSSRGKNCNNTRLTDRGGCCIWYNEMQYLNEVEEHLGETISQIDSDMKVPVNEFDGKVTYGQKRKNTGGTYKGHVAILAPAVSELANLEKRAQTSFLRLSGKTNTVPTF